MGPLDKQQLEQARKRNPQFWRQLAGPGRDIRDPRVLQAMMAVPRERFMPPGGEDRAYEDRALGIGHGQTISQPYVVAFMTEQLELQPTDRVLEIGTGSGYQAAVLAELAREVYTVEIVEPLAERSRRLLRELGYDNVHVGLADGHVGWPEHAPFDAILVACAARRIPETLLEQLAEHGRMIIPVGDPNDQRLILVRKENGTVSKREVLPVRFVPMTGRG